MLTETDRLRARFNLAVAYANRALEGETPSEDDLRKAAEQAKEVHGVVTQTLEEASAAASAVPVHAASPRSKQQSGKRTRAVTPASPAADLAENLLRPVTVLLAGVLTKLRSTGKARLVDPAVGLGDLVKEIADYGDDDHPPSLSYALACYYAARGDSSGGNVSKDYATKAMDHLAMAMALPPLRQWASKDPWLRPLHGRREWKALFAEKAPAAPVPPKPTALG